MLIKHFRLTKLSESSGVKLVYHQLKFEYVCQNRCQAMGKVHVIFDNPSYFNFAKSSDFTFQNFAVSLEYVTGLFKDFTTFHAYSLTSGCTLEIVHPNKFWGKYAP